MFESFREEVIQSGLMPEQNYHVLNNYEDAKLPYSRTERFEFNLPQQTTIDQLLGFFSSVSYYTTYCKAFPSNTLLKRLKDTYEVESGKCAEEKFSLPGFALLGLKED